DGIPTTKVVPRRSRSGSSALSPLPVREKLKVRVRCQRPARLRFRLRLRLIRKIEDGVLFSHKDMRAFQVDELRLVLDQRAANFLTLLGAAAGIHIFEAVPPDFGDAVEARWHAPRLSECRRGLGRNGVALDILAGAHALRETPHQRPVLLEPVGAEILERNVIALANDIHEFDHKTSSVVSNCTIAT